MSKFIRVYNNVIPKKLCKEIVKLFEASPEYQDAGKTASGYVNEDFKITTDIHLPMDNKQWKEIDDKLSICVRKAITRYVKDNKLNGFICGQFKDTGYVFQRYLPNNKDQFRWHSDCSSLAVCNRALAAVFYLNDVEEGGETEFRDNDLVVKPKAGSVLLFPPNFTTIHRGKKTKSGPKYIMTTFYTYTNAAP